MDNFSLMNYTNIFINNTKSKLVLLIDPDKVDNKLWDLLNVGSVKNHLDLILVGGSHISNPVNNIIAQIKDIHSYPVFLFPGNPIQISKLADALLLLMLISGRNSEYLIGHHVTAAPFIKKNDLEAISTGYILIGGDGLSSVEYVSQTRSIPADKTDIIISTAVAGELIGNKLLYLEAGSGSANPINPEIIRAIKKNVNIPIIVGGGIVSPEQLKNNYEAGADAVVVGTAIENNPDLLLDFVEMKLQYNSKNSL